MTNRQLQAIETKNRIYQAAIKLMEQQGFQDMKIEEVCKLAGVSVGSFYNYFKSKNEILMEIYKRADHYFESVVAQDLTEDRTADKIITYFVHYAAYNEMTGLETVKQLFHPSNKLFVSKGRFMQALLMQVIKEGQEKGEISTELSPEDMTEFFFIAARGISYDWCSREGAYDQKAYVKDYFSRLIRLFVL
ncbi:MAG: TetR/AcrR family transcriptional regulator [Firmicutes bacterium]|nr:TetR/AcrR family transcriptional regulator [Bacillota bacterium]